MLHDFEIWLCGCQTRFHVALAGNCESLAAIEHLATFIFQSLDRMLDHIDGVLVDQRPHHCFPIQRISNRQALVSSQKFIANL